MAVRDTTGATSSANTSLSTVHTSKNVWEPSHNSQSMLFIRSKGRRTSLGARNHRANHRSKRLNRFSIRKTTILPLTPTVSGFRSSDPTRAHHTGVLHGYCSANGWDTASAKSTQSPQKSIQVHNTSVSMLATPVSATRRRVWTRCVKCRRYHEATPQKETTNQRPYHGRGYSVMLNAAYKVPSRYCWP